MNELENKVTVVEKAAPKKRASRAKVAAPKVEAIQVAAAPVYETPAVPAFIDPRERQKAELRAKIAKEREYKAQLVTGKFLFNECPGGELKFSFREFPGDPKVDYVMRHDTIHTVPLGVAQHLNDRCAYPEYQHNLDNGKAVDIKNMYIMSKVHRTSFIPLNFTMDSGYKPAGAIAQVTYADPRQHNLYNQDATGR